MDLFNALLVTHTFRNEFALDRARALRMRGEEIVAAPVADPQPEAPMPRAITHLSRLGLLMRRLLLSLRGTMPASRTLPHPH